MALLNGKGKVSWKCVDQTHLVPASGKLVLEKTLHLKSYLTCNWLTTVLTFYTVGCWKELQHHDWAITKQKSTASWSSRDVCGLAQCNNFCPCGETVKKICVDVEADKNLLDWWRPDSFEAGFVRGRPKWMEEMHFEEKKCRRRFRFKAAAKPASWHPSNEIF